MNTRRMAISVVIMALSGSALSAALLNVTQDAPIINFNSNGQMSYDAVTGAFKVDATPLAITFADENFAFIDAPRAFRIRLQVDSAGNASSNGFADDLAIEGAIDVDGDGTADYSGLLLAGKISAFGYLNTKTNTDSYDFIFNVTGGNLAGLFAGGQAAVTLTSENSSFTGAFTSSFAGNAKGDVGYIPCPPQAVSGRVICYETDESMESVAVTVYDTTGQVVGSTLTASDGSYVIGDLVAGAVYTVSITVPDYAVACADTSLTVTADCASGGAIANFCVCWSQGGGTEGCTPGYWKNHTKRWPAPYKPTDSFNQTFGVNAFKPNVTLLAAAKQGGGGIKALGRHAVAALLSSATSAVDYGIGPQQVINMVQAALAPGGKIEQTKNELEGMNERGCPLN